ncbi:MAG: magnesium transporter [Gammaproteobacteria bacterium]
MTENNNHNEIDHVLNDLFMDRYPADTVHQLEQTPLAEVVELFQSRPPAKTLKIWQRFSPAFGARILDKMTPDYCRDLLALLEPNLGGSLLKALEESRRLEILELISDRYIKNDLIRAMTYQEDTAGALMESRLMYFRPEMTVSEAIKIMRGRKSRDMYRKLYTVDENNQLHGLIEMQDIALADHEEPLSRIERRNPDYVESGASREELVEMFETRKVTDLPVVDMNMRLIGVLQYHVLVGAALEESSMDMQTMVGVSKDERALSPAGFATRKRLPWLQVNLVTAFLAAGVVGIFESTIAQFTALAVLLPVVAGQSGNTGAQSLAVTMRGLALKEIYPRMWPRVVFKEFNVGLMNGIAVAVTTGLGVFIWSQSIGLTGVIMVSMVISMTIASVSGSLIPIILTVVGQDPAQSSSIFLTTVTDIFGFFSFLGIATLFMGML